jgi:hypothetical protein
LKLPPGLPIFDATPPAIGNWSVREDDIDFEVPVELHVADSVFVIGFPLGKNGGSDLLSIWTQATVASEPSIDLDGRPRFLVDGRTRSGLSDAPVYAYLPAGARSPKQRDPEMFISTLNQYRTALVGVYSSRVSEESDLGFVWKAGLIEEIIDGRMPGTPVDYLLVPSAG